MDAMIQQWPNGLGWDVGPHEIWRLAGGQWGVRTFDADGVPYKSLKIDPVADGGLFPLTQQEAVARCLTAGDLIP